MHIIKISIYRQKQVDIYNAYVYICKLYLFQITILECLRSLIFVYYIDY